LQTGRIQPQSSTLYNTTEAINSFGEGEINTEEVWYA